MTIQEILQDIDDYAAELQTQIDLELELREWSALKWMEAHTKVLSTLRTWPSMEYETRMVFEYYIPWIKKYKCITKSIMNWTQIWEWRARYYEKNGFLPDIMTEHRALGDGRTDESIPDYD